jgi:glutaredoxin-dependent peroxiredoxin
MPLKIGDSAPELTLVAHDMETISLSSYRGSRPVVLLFFPLAFTSTCTEELCTVGDDLDSFGELDAQVLAISVDSPFVLQRFRDECRAEFPFLSDFNREAATAFEVLRRDPLGPGLFGVADRAVFVVAQDGTIAYVWHSTNPGLLPPLDEVKGALRSLRATASA